MDEFVTYQTMPTATLAYSIQVLYQHDADVKKNVELYTGSRKFGEAYKSKPCTGPPPPQIFFLNYQPILIKIDRNLES